MARRPLTNEEYQDKLDRFFHGEFVFISGDTSKCGRVVLRHTCCAYEFSVSSSAPFGSTGKYSFCPQCRVDIRSDMSKNGEKLWKHKPSTRIRKNKYDTDKYKEKVFNICGKEYSVLGEYTKSIEKIRMRHNTCGHEWDVTAGAFISKNGTRCPRCNNGGATYNTDIFSRRVAELVGDEYTVLGEYIKNDVQILMRHNECGHEWNIRPEFFTGAKQSRCPKCNRGPVDRDTAIQRIESARPNEFDILEYTASTKGIKVLNKKCSHEYVIQNLSSLIKHKKCPVCHDHNKNESKLAKENKINDITDHVSSIIGNDFKVIECTLKKCVLEHSCGRKINVAIDIAKKPICPKCNCKPKKNRRFVESNNIKASAEFIKTMTNSDYSVLFYGNSRKNNAVFVHHSCGTKFVKNFQDVFSVITINKHPCPNCCGKRGVAKTNEEFQLDLDNRFGKGKFYVVGQYKSGETHIMVKHECGYKYEVLPSTLLSKHKNRKDKCPACSSLGISTGERKIKEILDSLGAEYEMQYKISGCKRNRHHLRFDFAVFKSGKLLLLIEFDGEQHFKPVKHFGGEKSFKTTVERDKIKNDFCKANFIQLLRIPYNEFDNLELIIKSNLDLVLENAA